MPTFPNQGAQGTGNAGTDPSVLPLSSNPVTVGTTATALGTVPGDGAPVVLSNGTGGTVYVGNSNVTTTTGYALAASTSVLVAYGEFAPDFGGVSASLYGVTASGTSTVTVLSVTNWPGNE